MLSDVPPQVDGLSAFCSRISVFDQFYKIVYIVHNPIDFIAVVSGKFLAMSSQIRKVWDTWNAHQRQRRGFPPKCIKMREENHEDGLSVFHFDADGAAVFFCSYSASRTGQAESRRAFPSTPSVSGSWVLCAAPGIRVIIGFHVSRTVQLLSRTQLVWLSNILSASRPSAQPGSRILSRKADLSRLIFYDGSNPILLRLFVSLRICWPENKEFVISRYELLFRRAAWYQDRQVFFSQAAAHDHISYFQTFMFFFYRRAEGNRFF
jgi:hypothetical protein